MEVFGEEKMRKEWICAAVLALGFCNTCTRRLSSLCTAVQCSLRAMNPVRQNIYQHSVHASNTAWANTTHHQAPKHAIFSYLRRRRCEFGQFLFSAVCYSSSNADPRFPALFVQTTLAASNNFSAEMSQNQ